MGRVKASPSRARWADNHQAYAGFSERGTVAQRGMVALVPAMVARRRGERNETARKSICREEQRKRLAQRSCGSERGSTCEWQRHGGQQRFPKAFGEGRQDEVWASIGSAVAQYDRLANSYLKGIRDRWAWVATDARPRGLPVHHKFRRNGHAVDACGDLRLTGLARTPNARGHPDEEGDSCAGLGRVRRSVIEAHYRRLEFTSGARGVQVQTAC